VNALVYVRVSTSEQVENYSLETQERECRSFCERNGWDVIEVFRDEGQSAKTANRPALQKLLTLCTQEARKLEITAVVVYKVDRLSRQIFDHVNIVSQIRSAGVEIYSTAEHFDDTPAGRLTEGMFALFAQFDNDVRAERTTTGMKAAAEQGRWVWPAPLGYTHNPMKPPSLLPDPEAAPLIARAIAAIADRRLNQAEALREATELGLRSHSGKPVPAQTFGKLVRNPLMCGRLVKPAWEIDVIGDFEPIIDEATFRAAEGVLSGRTPGRRHTLDNPDFPLRRIVRCAACGSAYTGSHSRSKGRRYAYYRCSRSGCSRSTPKSDFEADLLKELSRLEPDPAVLDLLDAVVKHEWEQRVRADDDARRVLERKEAAVALRLTKLTDRFLEGTAISEELFETQSVRINKELGEVRSGLDKLGSKQPHLRATVVFARFLLADLADCWKRLEPLERPQFLRAIAPMGFTYDGEHFETVDFPDWTTLRDRPAVPDSRLVPRTGFEPVLPE
jgi:site-specific DNA recombinase